MSGEGLVVSTGSPKAARTPQLPATSARSATNAKRSGRTTPDTLDITDLNPASAKLTATQTVGLDTLSISDGTHTLLIGLTGTFTTTSFHLVADGHGGTMLSYR